jgi:uncharacterized membrane protein
MTGAQSAKICGRRYMTMSENEKISKRSNGQPIGIVHHQESFSGPVPHPEIIEKYEKILPGAAERIFKSWENQTEHRQSLERSVVKTDNAKSILGVVLGFIVVVVTIIGGIVTAINGHPLFGSGLSLVGLAMLATAFITSRKPSSVNSAGTEE